MKTITIDLFNKDSVNKAIAEIEAVKSEWERKAKVCSEMIAAMLADQIEANLDAIPYTDDMVDIKAHTPIPKNSPFGVYAYGNKVIVRGEEVAFVEFGAGVYHNGEGGKNPLSEAVQFDTLPGGYGKGQGIYKYWFVAHNLISRGTPAYMPIHNAIEAIKPLIPTAVRQVFV